MHEIMLHGHEGNAESSGEVGGFADHAKRMLTEQMTVECQSCSLRLKVPQKYAGKSIRCPGCGASVKIPTVVFDPEAFDSTSTDRTEEATLAVAVEHAVTKRHKYLARKSSNWGTLKQWVVLGAACVFVGALVYFLNTLRDAPPPKVTEVPAENQEYLDTPIVKIAPKRAVPAEIKLQNAQWDYFANHMGYFPASPQMRYCVISLNLSAGDEPIKCSPANGGVRLEADQEIYACLGRAIDVNSTTIAKADYTPIFLRPGKQEQVDLLFYIPAKSLTARLVVNNVLDAKVELESPPAFSTQIAGVYKERLPRNLKPMFRDPVMRSLQKTSLLSMRVFTAGSGWAVNVPQVGMAGSIVRGQDGVFDVVLQSSKGRIACKAVLLGDNTTLVLYLDDEPMHQLIFERVQEK